jgi:hypothetical protein
MSKLRQFQFENCTSVLARNAVSSHQLFQWPSENNNCRNSNLETNGGLYLYVTCCFSWCYTHSLHFKSTYSNFKNWLGTVITPLSVTLAVYVAIYPPPSSAGLWMGWSYTSASPVPAQACQGVTFTFYLNIPTYKNYIWSKKSITFCISFLPSTEADIQIFPPFCIQIYSMALWAMHIFSMTHLYFVKVVQRSLFTLSHAHKQTHTHRSAPHQTQVSTPCSNNKVIQLMADSPCQCTLYFPMIMELMEDTLCYMNGRINK